MPGIRYVVLSDLHFGASNSTLTSLAPDEGGGLRCDPGQPSPLLGPLFACLRELTGDQSDKPALVLAGDVLDLALSPEVDAARAFEPFADHALGPDGIFGDVVYYVPGNHDHHLWEQAREAQYAKQLESLPKGAQLPEPWHTTHLSPLDPLPDLDSGLLASLIRRRPSCGDVTVRVRYPNLALSSADGGRMALVSHGHFTESIYMLMSAAMDLAFPQQRDDGQGRTVATIEQENFAWIDFLWSTLGQSGRVGADLGILYADLASARAIDDLAVTLIRGLLELRGRSRLPRRLEARLLAAIFGREANRVVGSERSNVGVVLTRQVRGTAREYLEGPVALQVAQEMGALPPAVTFVFGHTHKPFAEQWLVPGFPSPLQVLNTGGWVVDTVAPAEVQGAAAVVVDEDARAVAIELYRQSSDGGVSPPRVIGTDPLDPLHQWVTSKVDAGREPWRSLTETAATLVRQRHELQRDILSGRD